MVASASAPPEEATDVTGCPATTTTSGGSGGNGGNGNGHVLDVKPAYQYQKDATLSQIFGGHVTPGRELLDVIMKTYKVPSNKTLPWYQGAQRTIARHPLNSRRQQTVLTAYTKSVQQKGIVRGVRGECWLQAPNTEEGEMSYLALTFATLSEAFYQANEAPDREDYPNLLTTAKYGLDVLIFDHRTPQSVLQFLITYHNAFHQGAETSFMEMIMKVPEVEKAWANYKVANGISSRQSDYESKYREMLTSQFPATWTSFRHFEATRQVYNVLSKLNCLVELKTFISDHCDFLHNELTHDTVVFVMKEVLTALPTVFNIMVPLNISEIPWLLRRSASAGQEIALVLTAVDGKVFETQRKMRVQKEKRKGQKNPQQVLSENLVAKKAKEEKAAIAAAKAKAKGKCKPKAAAAKNNLNEELADDTTKESQSVTLTDTGGIAVSRPKLFADCLVLCIRSAITAARTKYGLAQGVEEESLVPDSAADPIKYTDAEINIIRPAVRAGLIFAIQGSHMFNGKVYKKWSALRPALQCHLMEAYKKAS
ncbi:Uncharacterized protein SCF082_LOCUS49142 [Durusdinium trenchii]|uniref:Uncharacterized protein n=1 Tax=Durusdinium trenchii TaxID=1381693 RepID=A0ABP0RXT7_9DINO